MSASMQARLEALAAARVLLVASDFDGVLAPIVPHPNDAAINPAADLALRRLAAIPRTFVGIVSGRALEDLRPRVPPGLLLVGSHGAERDHAAQVELPLEARASLDALASEMAAIQGVTPGAIVERKPTSVAFHFRQCDPQDRDKAVRRVVDAAAAHPTLIRRDGLMVVEFAAVRVDKGHGLIYLMHRSGATATVFIGDDQTDEDAFGALEEHGVSIKVGGGPTRALERLPDPETAARWLQQLAEHREAAVRSADALVEPIQRHSVLSDQRTLAVVDSWGSIVWMCLPRADSEAVFARMLGGPAQGEFSVKSLSDAMPPEQSYVGASMVLRTAWRDMTLLDYLDCSGGRAYQRAGRTDLIRRLEGSGRAIVRFAPRLDFGREATRVVVRDGGLEVEGSPDPFVVVAPGVTWRIEDDGRNHTAHAEVDLAKGPVVIELRYGFGGLGNLKSDEAERRAQTERFWGGWLRTLRLPSRRPDLVMRSALALKALCYGPTGAVYAAATTSLPEQIGGVRNWDYRYCWPRDACLAGAALTRLGNTGIAMKLLDWLLGVVDRTESPERLRPLYTVSGFDLGSEAEIGDLPGYAGSRPVRVGNAADRQVQLDVFGPIVDLVARLVESGAPVTPEHWRLVQAMVSAVAARWNEPDHGIWEVRGPKAHHVHTKVMCWHAVDRAIFVSRHVLGRERPEMYDLRERIRADVLENGWNERVQSFSFRHGGESLDAATLTIGLVGLVPPDDPRFIATVRAVQRDLLEDGVVYRYREDDGLPGIEGGFHICTSWLIESLQLIGARAEAEELFDRMCAFAGPTGLLPEQADPRTGRGLGNFPQAYSHLGLINAAVALG